LIRIPPGASFYTIFLDRVALSKGVPMELLPWDKWEEKKFNSSGKVLRFETSNLGKS
jgi:hypothetical protein